MKSFNHQNNKKRKAAWKKIIVTVMLGAVLLAIACIVSFNVLVGRQNVSLLEQPLPAATIVYDQNMEEVLRLSPSKSEAVSYDSLPEQLIEAVVAVEDKRFFEHSGTDLQGIGRALMTNLSSGKTVQGASTITQQLAKNVFLSQERTWTRKWKELLLAQKIERNYNKQQIITFYLNQIYFGEGAWGIKKAAEVYFGVPVNELTLSESALLAGIIKAPSALTPYRHPDEAKARRNVVLQLMKDQGKIDQATYAASIAEPLHILSSKPASSNVMKYPYYIDQMIREAGEKYGLTQNEVLQGGLRFYTTLDSQMQEAVEDVYAQDSNFPTSSSDQLIQSGAVLVDPRDGGIRALVGGRGDQPFRSFNRAVQLKRQPGSTMKPISVYTPALEHGYSPDDTLIDEPVNFNGYQPGNAGDSYHGEVTIYESIIHSYNVPAVKLLNELGIDAGMESSKRFGLELTDADRNLGLALGGLSEGVSPLEMAEAFSVFANDGTRIPTHTITRIETADGEIVAENNADDKITVTEPAIARTMTAMLEGVVTDGTGVAAAVEGRQIAGKSGTTEMPGTGGEGMKDNWFVGYTPQLVGAVWLGYDHTDATHYLTTTSKAAAAVFQKLMSEALQDEPVMNFPAVPGIKKESKDKDEEKETSKKDEKEKKNEKKKEKKSDTSKSNKEEKKNKKSKNEEQGKGNGKDKD
ncbi:penicillin-binding protein 2A [Paenibacillus cellulosilyticus]|uniref:Penicillin-binding protein 2A n=1 Tax=Paenibacillus cellulosilyticus TaxID=375489 RepID=A0A2V2YTJ7_9BACL|nr:PBP1A family penicillin-binding protein [Paenibacillus cellulosilyticus]PWW02803.1 penicillin-binding protein 2A [Paenibacillus cellulosilyticus]QKS45725.1 PBP1A family penicillin-binding protein [Paenibacillus cellulosilyticus]